MPDVLLTEAGDRLVQEDGGALWIETRTAGAVVVSLADRVRFAIRADRVRRAERPTRTARVTLVTGDRA